MTSIRPEYEALDDQGYPYRREARTVSELPLAERRPALDAALATVSESLKMLALQKLNFGVPVFAAFGLNRREAERHERAALLLTMCADLSLDFVPAYTSASG